MDKLGIQPLVLVTQLINFGILVIVLNKFLYKPVVSFLAKRKQKIAEGVKASEEALKEREKLEKKKQELLKEAKAEVAAILSTAKKDAQKMKDALLKEAQHEAEGMRTKEEKDLKARYAQLEAELRGQTVDVAAKMVEKLLSDGLSKEAQTKIIESQVKKLKSAYKA
jgi:F-type H+-transporting ATPase subunit b